MFSWNQQGNQPTSADGITPVEDASLAMAVDQNGTPAGPKNEAQDGGPTQAEYIVYASQKILDEIRSVGLKIKHHEDNIKNLQAEKSRLDDAIQDKEIILGEYATSTIKRENEDPADNEEEILRQIMHHDRSTAALLCQLNAHHGHQASHLAMTKHVLGIVANLGKVDNDNLSRLFSKYLGLETMMAVVCINYEGVKALEKYDQDGCIDKSSGIHGLAASVGRTLEGRYRVICLDDIRPYSGELLEDDRQRRLNLLKPKLPNGEYPPGFLGFAVNMINVDSRNLIYLTPKGYGLRETLFYSLFSRLQVYKTRADMLQALPCITNGALSLDGGMIRSVGRFSLGDSGDMSVGFPVSSTASSLEGRNLEIKNLVKELKLKQEKVLRDMPIERQILDQLKVTFERKKQQYLGFISQSSSVGTQPQVQGARSSSSPRVSSDSRSRS